MKLHRAIDAMKQAGYTNLAAHDTLCKLVEFAAQNPGLDRRNYYDPSASYQHFDRQGYAAYNQESRSISHDWQRLKAALKEAAQLGITDAEIIAAAPRAFSGRMTWGVNDTAKNIIGWSYCTGQYFPTEYRKAAASVIEYANSEHRRSNPQLPTIPPKPTRAAMKEMNRAAGQHWFDKSSMKFFDSKLHGEPKASGGLWYFISSEQFHGSQGSAPRKYTIRTFDPLTADVDEAEGHSEGFQKYRSLHDAQQALKAIIRKAEGSKAA